VIEEGVASWDVDEADIVVSERYLVVNVEDVMLIRNSDMLNGSKAESVTLIPTELVNCTIADIMIVLSCAECTQLHCAESTQLCCVERTQLRCAEHSQWCCVECTQLRYAEGTQLRCAESTQLCCAERTQWCCAERT